MSRRGIEAKPTWRQVPDAVSVLASYFAASAWQEEIPGLPRLRPFGRRQLDLTLPWAAWRLELPLRDWLEGMA